MQNTTFFGTNKCLSDKVFMGITRKTFKNQKFLWV